MLTKHLLEQKESMGEVDFGEPKWFFGIVDRANHKCFVQFIPDKSHPSIIPII